MERINGILSKIVQNLGIIKEVEKKDALSIWPQIAKELGVKKAEVFDIKRGTLWIAVKKAGERQEIMMKKSEILSAYRSRGFKIEDVKFVRECKK